MSRRRTAPDALAPFLPVVRRWFTETLGEPSDPQVRGWPAIASGAHTLILAPTGTGKTLAAFLWELNALLVRGQTGPLPNAVQILYVSPLKALGNDVQRNLERPLADLRARLEAAGGIAPEIRVAVRTGDTTPSARARMLRRTPHILITTPESLAILLTTERGRGIFPGVRAVLIDEIHAVAGGKRGAHLALTLERLDALCRSSGAEVPQRIGLSATQRPLDEVARFLGGCEPGPPEAPRRFRDVTIVDCGLVKRMDLRVRSPVPDLARVDGSVWPAVAALVLGAVSTARTTLVFVNNRGQAERMAARLNTLAGSEVARPYHGSLAKERRLALERALKAGELRALVTTSALELGIDIGAIDLVLQLQSPKRVAAAVQRVGRAGHTIRDVSRGVIVPTFRDDLMESVAVVDAALAGEVEATRVPQNALDVLAQTLIALASTAAGPQSPDLGTTADDAFALVRGAYPYHRLSRAAFEETLGMVSGKYPADLAADLEPRITWDRATGRITGTRGSRMTAVISGGTIPDRGLYTVHLPDRTRLGELDEEFVHESRVGDVFQLGSSTWRIATIEHDRVVVTPAPGSPARMPFWHGEFVSRSVELGRRVGTLRRELATTPRTPSGGDVADSNGTGHTGDGDGDDASAGDERVDAAFAERHHCDVAAARTLRTYVAEQRVATGVVPDDRTLVVEHFRDEMDAVRIVIHTTIGGRATAPWGMALAQRARELLGGVDVQVQTSDDGIMLRLPSLGGPPPVHALLALPMEEAERRVREEVGSSALFGARFRMNAARALLLPRGIGSRRMPLWLQRLRALDLLETVRRYPAFPLLVETYRDVLQDAFDLGALRETLTSIAAGVTAVHIVETDRPSPFATSLQFGFVMDWLYVDDTPRAERAAAALSIDHGLLDDIMGADGAGDEALAQALDEVLARRNGTAPGRQARTADELAHRLARAGDLTLDELRARVGPPESWREGRDPVAALVESGRAAPTASAGGRFVLAEDRALYDAASGAERSTRVTEGARREVLARRIGVSGALIADAIAARYDWPVAWVAAELAAGEEAGRLVRGVVRSEHGAAWYSRRLVARARRRALAGLRAEIEATDVATFTAFLQRWQHLDPRDRLDGDAGLAHAIAQLDGLARPAAGWERDYLSARVTRYDPAALARQASGGALVWAGGPPGGMVRFFGRGEGAIWMPAPDDLALSEAAVAVRAVLARDGASFVADLVAATARSPLVVRDALRELVSAGVVTNDTVDALREVIRTPPLASRARREEPDPTRWLPAGFTPSVGRRGVVQRRTNAGRLPRWRRPDRPGADGAVGGTAGWVGRWSLLATPGTTGPARSEEEQAAVIAERWLARYGIVSRDWWRRERPPVGWRAIYRELRRLELRGTVRRGYFVIGLAGAQFALPDAVERLRAARVDGDAPWVVMAASDPANPYPVVLRADRGRDALRRPRGPGALLVTRRGVVVLAAEGRGRRVHVAPVGHADVTDPAVTDPGDDPARVAGLTNADVTAAAAALADYLIGRAGPSPGAARRRVPVLDAIDGAPAATSRWAEAFRAAGFRRGGSGLEYPVPITVGR
jgi:ATP-dependent Lhr-like helicase